MGLKVWQPTKGGPKKWETNADGYVFRLHYRGTTLVCFVACIFLVAFRFFQPAIHCMSSDRYNDGPKSDYCYTAATYIGKHKRPEYGSDVPHPGVWEPDSEEIIHKNFFQLIPVLLAISGCLFYLPHAIWQALEGKNLEHLLQGQNGSTPDADSTSRKDLIIRYMKITRGFNFVYSLPYLICEILNLVNVILQLVLMDVIARQTFSNYGYQALSLIIDSKDPDMEDIFPRLMKCTFESIGRSGTIAREDLLCALPQNVLTEKVLIAIWVWFVAVATITVAQVAFKLLLYMSSDMRSGMIECYGKLILSGNVRNTVSDMTYGDFFFLELLARNLDTVTFRDVLMHVCDSEFLAASALICRICINSLNPFIIGST
ncbi:innexin inx3-like [Oratosquilla oratoria]|uniref:innexin inx3-like n=1 Tax=Oratosquilla oratoria TaxID=337810 RepID=UPI003F7701A0